MSVWNRRCDRAVASAAAAGRARHRTGVVYTKYRVAGASSVRLRERRSFRRVPFRVERAAPPPPPPPPIDTRGALWRKWATRSCVNDGKNVVAVVVVAVVVVAHVVRACRYARKIERRLYGCRRLVLSPLRQKVFRCTPPSRSTTHFRSPTPSPVNPRAGGVATDSPL